MDSVEINSEAIYLGFQSVNYAKKTMTKLTNLLSANNIDYKLVNELGYEGNTIINNFGNVYSKLMEFYSQLVKTKNILLKADPNNEYLFQLIDLQFKGMDLGEEPSQADYASYIETMGDVYHAAKKKNSSELTDYEKSIIQAYEEAGFAEFDSYQEMLKEIEDAQTEYNKLSDKYKTGNGIGGYSVNTDYYEEAADKKRMAELKEKIYALEDKTKVLEKDLKEKGLLELSGWDELKIAGKKYVKTIKDLTNNIADGNFDDAIDNVKTLTATNALVAEKVVSGVLKIGEYVNDGLTMLKATGASVYTLGIDAIFGTNYTDELWDATMDYVAIDQIGNMEKFYYEKTKLGQFNNDNSLLKYDSKGAEAIKSVSTKVGEVTIATVITVATGGTAAPVVAAGVGFLEGTGQGGEKYFSMTDEDGNYTNRDVKSIGLSYLDGVQKGAEWYISGQVGSSVVKGFNSYLNPATVTQEVIGQATGNTFKDAVINTVKLPDMYVDFAAATAKAGAGYITNGEIDWQSYALEMGFAVLGNFAGELLSAAGTNKLLKEQNIPSTDEISEIMKFASTKDSIDSIRDVEYSLRSMMEKYGIDYDASLHRLELLISEHNYDIITRYGGARDLIKKYSIEELDEMYKQLVKMKNLPTSVVDDIQNSITMMVDKYWLDPDTAFKRIELLIKNKDYSYLSDFDSVENLLKKYSFEDLELAYKKFAIKDIKVKPIKLKPISSNRTTNFFDELNYGNSNFGVDQGCLYSLCEYEYKGQKYSYRDAKEIYNDCLDKGLVPPAFAKRDNEEYMRLKDKLKNTYGFDSYEASVIISSVDNTGACSYASVCNEIFSYFKNDPVAFKNQFGFDMFRIVDGKKTLNSTELLLDMYVNANMKEYGGNFFIKQLDGTYSISRGYLGNEVDPLGRRLLDTKEQVYLGTSIGKNNEFINKYLSSKSLKYNSYMCFKSNSADNKEAFEDLLRNISSDIENGNGSINYSMGIYKTDKQINMISLEGKYNCSTFNWNEGGGHATYITGLTNDGFVVSSWGEKYLIPYNDILNSGSVDIIRSTIWR